MTANLTDYRRSRARWWAIAVGVACVALGAGASPGMAQEERPAEGAVAEAHPESGARWLRVVEEDDGETIKLQLVSREYRRENGEGPSVFLTGAVHIGDASFYRELQEFLDAKDVVLFEGVKPPGAGRLAHNADQDDADALVQATKRRIRFVATFVEKFKREHKAYPATLDELAEAMDGRIAKLLAGCASDAWGRRFE